jgi:hypothetical protein
MQSLIEEADKLCEEEAALRDRAKKTRDYDAYEKYVEVYRLEQLVNERADSIVARAQEQAKVDKVKIISHSATKTRNTKNMDTRAGKRKSTRKEVSMTEDSPCRKHIRSEVRDAKIRRSGSSRNS